jgi:broad specificity phosphatase PhoE
VITSDLRRCDYFARQFGCVVESEPRLREQDMGEWEGKSWAELTERDPAGVTAYWDDYARARPTGGESWGEAAARVASWWDAIREPTGHIVVITHIGPIRALLCHWLGLPPTEALRFAPVCASETRVLHADAGVVIEAMGLPP